MYCPLCRTENCEHQGSGECEFNDKIKDYCIWKCSDCGVEFWVENRKEKLKELLI